MDEKKGWKKSQNPGIDRSRGEWKKPERRHSEQSEQGIDIWCRAMLSAGGGTWEHRGGSSAQEGLTFRTILTFQPPHLVHLALKWNQERLERARTETLLRASAQQLPSCHHQHNPGTKIFNWFLSILESSSCINWGPSLALVLASISSFVVPGISFILSWINMWVYSFHINSNASYHWVSTLHQALPHVLSPVIHDTYLLPQRSTVLNTFHFLYNTEHGCPVLQYEYNFRGSNTYSLRAYEQGTVRQWLPSSHNAFVLNVRLVSRSLLVVFLYPKVLHANLVLHLKKYCDFMQKQLPSTLCNSFYTISGQPWNGKHRYCSCSKFLVV